jgi:hypothetical protein
MNCSLVMMRTNWGFDDPAEVQSDRQLAVFRTVRDEILGRLRLFVSSNRD